jgi:hypothetical protein
MEIRNSTGQLDFSRITPELIAELDEPRQNALLALMKANESKEAAIARRNAATKRLADAITDEAIKREIAEDASSPVPLAPMIREFENKQGRPATPSELLALKERQQITVRGLREAEARRAVVAAYNASH